MANEVKYQNQVWGEPIAGERLSTNGHYTGEHKGTPTQDKLGVGTTNGNAHYVEENIVRYGTMTQDAIEGSTPKVVVDGE
jgi:hypothetical protein